MNYQKIYDDIIYRAKTRILESYTEIHHILPRCMGGSDNIDNLVELTPEEHYLAHQLLVKIYPNNHKLVIAANMMIPNRPSNKLYGWLRRRHQKAMSICQSGEGNSQFGTRWIYSDELKESKKIGKNESLPAGWFEGRKLNFGHSKKELERAKQKEERIQYLRDLYEIYKTGGYDAVRKTGYLYSKPNLVQTFARNLEEFVPQNGKKRS